MALPIKMILVPMQLDDPEAAALRVAKRLAQENDASICAMHVIPIEPLEITPGAPTDIYARDLEKAKEDLQRITDQHLGGIKHQLATHFAGHAEISATIIQAAKDVNADLIVMKTHGRHGSAFHHRQRCRACGAGSAVPGADADLGRERAVPEALTLR